MLRILFVDHGFHAKTASSQFFQDILRERFAVECVMFDPDLPDPALLALPPDIYAVVLWQLDYLAPVFLAQGARTLVVPMYDGSSGLSDEHFLAARGAVFINFSRALHERVRMLGLPSMLLRYYPPPVREELLPRFDTLHGFLWRRRPEEGIDLKLVSTLFGSQLASLHLHDAPDNAALALRDGAATSSYPFAISRSTWFDTPAAYLAQLETCNVFIAPRAAEGIGMAMLEAMARGMLVVSNDQPTHDEYICNWVNGVLFNKDAPGSADFTGAAALAWRGWRSVREGYACWLEQSALIGDFIEALPLPRPLPPRDAERVMRMVPRAFARGRAAYDRIIAGLVEMRLLDQMADEQPSGSAAFGIAHRQQAPVLTLAPGQLGVIDFAHGKARPFLRHGWSFDEADWIWVEGLRAALRFRLPPGEATDIALTCIAWTASAAHPEALRIGVLLNDRFVQEVRLGEGISPVTLRLPQFMLHADADNDMLFVMSSAFQAPNERRTISCAFCRLEFSAMDGIAAMPSTAIEEIAA